MIELKGKTAVISGAAEGIGLGVAREMGHQGMNIVLADINAAELANAEKSLLEQGVAVLAVPLDAADAAQWQRVAEQAIERFGKIHMLVNNAGVGGRPAPVDATPEKDWRWVIDVNLMGVVNGTQAIVPFMKQHGEGGWLINVASMAGLGGLPMAGPYSATKAAVVAISECWHAELQADNIQVSVLCPGFVKTRINKSQRNKQAQYETAGEGRETSAEVSALSDHMQNIIDAGLAPEVVGKRVVEAITAGELYIFTHPNYRSAVEKRFSAITDAFQRSAASPLLASVVDEEMPGLG
jgi:NAD(P)-dependent dehydrogenase (short-subunit alcohol dehydrogenase family)